LSLSAYQPIENGGDAAEHELYFRQKVDQGLRELDEGKGIPHDQARERLQKWLK
jgi:hypothetical protein